MTTNELILASVAVLAFLGGLAYWELIVCEGAHLGRGMVIWLYDRFAPRYDPLKGFNDTDEAYYIAAPLMQAVAEALGGMGRAPFVLDVATGTGRVPLALLQWPAFNGRVIGLDLSRAMLAQAAAKLAPYGARVALVRHPALPLPFGDESFDVVTCLEALEFMPDQAGLLRECARVLRPGGILLITRRMGRALFGLTQAQVPFAALVVRAGFAGVETRIWQVDYDQVWARKPGQLVRAGVYPLAEVVRCPGCGAVGLELSAREWACARCARRGLVAADGVVLLL